MELNHHFTVPVSIDQAWKILTDVERIAPCLPGAELQEIEGDTYRGVVKVKVGPIQAQFKGQASFVERDDAAYKIVLKGEGRDTGGKGNASALITAELSTESATSTGCVVTTDLAITGKVAQFGRGAMADISDKILAQFVQNLNALIASQPAVSTAATPVQTQDAGPRKIDGPIAAPINLLETAGSSIAKRAIPVLIVVAGIILYFIVK
ncbi:carbon monoxide dehydrogenase subunit G [Actinomycetes bacterium]|nr:carbon monoxide dehydrogenase subunit G [Actinomycetes bacterium]